MRGAHCSGAHLTPHLISGPDFDASTEPKPYPDFDAGTKPKPSYLDAGTKPKPYPYLDTGTYGDSSPHASAAGPGTYQ